MFSKSFDEVLAQVVEQELKERGPEIKARVTTEAPEALELCGKTHYLSANKACQHYYRECNLCGEVSFCPQHGCYLCELKAKNDSGALSAVPETERQMILTITEREANLPKQKKSGRKKKFANQRNLKEAWLEDYLASNQ